MYQLIQKIDIVNLSGIRESYILTEISDDYIIIDKEIERKTCFVYGTEVDDFHTISIQFLRRLYLH